MADLLFNNLNPEWANDINGIPWAADPNNFKEVLGFYLEKDIKVFVSGHGTLCTDKEIKDSIEFFDKILHKKVKLTIGLLVSQINFSLRS